MDAQKEVRAHFRRQADACRRLDSPFTARVCDLAAEKLSEDTRTGERMLTWPDTVSDDNVALRFCGALHALVLSGGDPALGKIYPPEGSPDVTDIDLWEAIEHSIHAYDSFIHNWLESPPQTNEVARAAMILPALMYVADIFNLPLSLFEIGASAGLTMQLATFYYDYAGHTVGNPDSPVRLSPEVRTPPPISAEMPNVIARRGCDINPLNPLDEQRAIRLQSYVWPDQKDRLKRIEGAISLFAASPPRIDKANAAGWVDSQLRELAGGTANVFYHTIVWQYFTDQTSRRLIDAFSQAGRNCTSSSPLALLGMDAHTPEHARLHLTTWSGVEEVDGREITLAHADYHGRWIEWIEPG